MSTHGGTSTSAPPATTVTGPDTIGAPAVVGTGLHYARNDHDHGLPALDYNALQYNDLLGWTFDPAFARGTSGGLSPTYLSVGRIPLPAAMTVTNVLVRVVTLGVTLTHSFLALFKSDGTIIGQSADQSTAWETGGAIGLYTLPLGGGPYVCTPLAANDFLLAAYYVGTYATQPFFSAVGNTVLLDNAGTTAARSRFSYIAQSDRATLVSINPASLTGANALPVWFGIS
jgi:hypothetical protein